MGYILGFITAPCRFADGFTWKPAKFLATLAGYAVFPPWFVCFGILSLPLMLIVLAWTSVYD